MVLVSPVHAPSHITDAIRKASEATGTDFDYLLTTAARESSFEPRARAKTSSAAGLFQFIESTWLQTVKEQGGRFGLQKYSPHIFRTGSGRFYVPNQAIRDEILELRHNPEISALMAGAFTQENAKYVSSRLGRDPTQGELYIAHFLGAGGATKLITLASKDPNARADTHFPRAAKANRSIFYSHRQARSVRQVYDQLVSDHSRLGATMLAVSRPGQSRSAPAATAMKAAARPDPSLNMSVVGAPSVNLPGSGWSERFPSFDPLAAVAPPIRTRVAALGYSPVRMQGETMTDSGMGGIGPWHTIVQPESAAGSPQGQVPEPDHRPSAEAQQAGEPRRVRLQTRLHGAPPPPEPNPVTTSARPATLEPQPSRTRDFANRFWELQALGGG